MNCVLAVVFVVLIVNVFGWRNKPDQEQQWGWGYYDAPNTRTTMRSQSKPTPSPVQNTPPVATEPLKNLDCSGEYAATPPNFNTGTRRISEVKCYEYLWQLKNRHDKVKWEKDCNKEQTVFISVIGGRNAKPGEFPHMGAIGWQGVSDNLVFLCGGTLISPNYVLTAAHCSKSPPSTNLADTIPKMVRLGYTNIKSLDSNVLGTLDDRTISRIITHPQYSPPKKYHDIALIELTNGVSFTKTLQPACLWPRADFNGLKTETNVTGWGVTIEKGSTGVQNLQVGTVNLVDSRSCNASLRQYCSRHWCGLTDTQLCAGSPSGAVDACQGDSGGPLQARIMLPPQFDSEGWMHHVIGVTSFGIGCGRPGVPGVYTRVSSYLDWIEGIVWPRE